MFINFSNHPFTHWSEEQTKAATAYGAIVDVPFPMVPADATAETVVAMADQCVSEILNMHPKAVMASGEFSLTYAVVKKLREYGITCLCACSERNVKEVLNEDGTTTKVVNFEFRQFRQYM